MVRRPQKDDISIGENSWISFGDLAGGQARAVAIDPQLAPLKPFIELLESECVAECCGIDAYCLWPEAIEKAVAKLDKRELEGLSSSLSSTHKEIAALPTDTVVSMRINNYFRKVVFLEILDHIRKVVDGIRRS